MRMLHKIWQLFTLLLRKIKTIGSAGGFDYHRISYPGVIIFKKSEKWLHLYRLKFYRYRRIIFFAVFIVLVTSMTPFVLGRNKLISKKQNIENNKVLKRSGYAYFTKDRKNIIRTDDDFLKKVANIGVSTKYSDDLTYRELVYLLWEFVTECTCENKPQLLSDTLRDWLKKEYYSLLDNRRSPDLRSQREKKSFIKDKAKNIIEHIICQNNLSFRELEKLALFDDEKHHIRDQMKCRWHLSLLIHKGHIHSLFVHAKRCLDTWGYQETGGVVTYQLPRSNIGLFFNELAEESLRRQLEYQREKDEAVVNQAIAAFKLLSLVASVGESSAYVPMTRYVNYLKNPDLLLNQMKLLLDSTDKDSAPVTTALLDLTSTLLKHKICTDESVVSFRKNLVKKAADSGRLRYMLEYVQICLDDSNTSEARVYLDKAKKFIKLHRDNFYALNDIVEYDFRVEQSAEYYEMWCKGLENDIKKVEQYTPPAI